MTNTIINIASLAGLAGVVIFGAVGLAPLAHAASPNETVTYRVSTAGLDLRTSRDAQSMLRRIEIAASEACGAAPVSADLNMTYQWRACVSHNVDHAVSKLASPMVSEIAHQPTSAQTASR